MEQVWCAERAWASAMSIKFEDPANTVVGNKRHHQFIARLRKAGKHATVVVGYASSMCSPRSLSEARCYEVGLKGDLKFAQDEWEEARVLYEEGGRIAGELGGGEVSEVS